jgi:hypothetical protein
MSLSPKGTNNTRKEKLRSYVVANSINIIIIFDWKLGT